MALIMALLAITGCSGLTRSDSSSSGHLLYCIGFCTLLQGDQRIEQESVSGDDPKGGRNDVRAAPKDSANSMVGRLCLWRDDLGNCSLPHVQGADVSVPNTATA